tara:strand:- start:213 stop:323 length:111 start_codon:yes stop_codon:yes gene_type:complete
MDEMLNMMPNRLLLRRLLLILLMWEVRGGDHFSCWD